MSGAPKLPRDCSGDDCIKALGRLGYVAERQRGSHVRLTAPGRRPVTVPRYDALGPGLLRKILRDAGVDVAAFTALLDA